MKYSHMTSIVLYHPGRNGVCIADYAWELIMRIRLGWEIIGEL